MIPTSIYIRLPYTNTIRCAPSRGQRYSMLTYVPQSVPALLLWLFWAPRHPNIQKPIFGAIGRRTLVSPCPSIHGHHTASHDSTIGLVWPIVYSTYVLLSVCVSIDPWTPHSMHDSTIGLVWPIVYSIYVLIPCRCICSFVPFVLRRERRGHRMAIDI